MCTIATSVTGEESHSEAAQTALLIEAEPRNATVPLRYTTLSVVLGGDLGMNASGQAVASDHVMRHGRRYSFGDLTRGLRPRLNADVVFANLETVVTPRNDIAAWDKTFNFKSHPAAVRHLVELGFNALSLANNHTIDYGETGMAETLRHVNGMRAAGLRAAPGLGIGRSAALAAEDIKLPQGRVRVSAVGIGGTGFGDARPVMGSFHGSDLTQAARALRDAEGDLKILSVHFGQEMQVRPSSSDEKRLRDAVELGAIDVVAGHHAHVAAGVQDLNGRIIFYGLGNLMHPGMRDMGSMGVCRDFGVLARVHYGRADTGKFRVRAIEVHALADMHAAVQVRSSEDARRRVTVLNHHAIGLDDATGGARGVRFKVEPDGTGLHCTSHAGDTDDALAARCSAVIAAEAPVPDRAIEASCGPETSIAERTPRLKLRIEASQQQPTRRSLISSTPARFDHANDR